MRPFVRIIIAMLVAAACAHAVGQRAFAHTVLYATVSATAYLFVVKSPLLRIRIIAALAPAFAALPFTFPPARPC